MQKNNFKHGEVISSFLIYLNNLTNSFVLKCGTALMLCYNLNRFSEDIDLDSTDYSIENYIEKFCNNNNYSYRVTKDTMTVKRFMLNYGDSSRLLKDEISYRKKNIENEDTNVINGIRVYNIENLALLIANAYSGRDKIIDLFDITFICNNNYYHQLPKYVKSTIRDVIGMKGIEQFDYLIRTQADDFIDVDTLETEFLKTLNILELLISRVDIDNGKGIITKS